MLAAVITLCSKKQRLVNMNSKHLTKDDECPELVPGSLRIYSMRFCPYAQRAVLVANAKGIKHDIVYINLMEKPKFIFEKNPDGKVPTIESADGKIVYESHVVSDYLDEAYNDKEKSAGDSSVRRLTPSDPYQKALDRIWLEKNSKTTSLDYQLYLQNSLTADQVAALIKQLNEHLKQFDDELKRRGTKFFCGNERPGMLDYMIWPWFERFPCMDLILKDYSGAKAALAGGKKGRPVMEKWEQAMMEDEAVKATYLKPEIHAKYRTMRRDGGPVDYNFLYTKK